MSHCIEQSSRRDVPGSVVLVLVVILLALLLALAGAVAAAPQSPPKTTPAKASAPAQQASRGKAFASPEQAAAELHAAAQNNDESALLVILGPEGREIVAWSDNPKERQDERSVFARKYDQMHRLVKEPDGTMALYVGAENWPLPIPLLQINGSWYFDANFGKKEILYRRIGRNELEALEVCHALVDAEKNYYASAHAYTQKFISGSSSHDGLYWPDAVANAQSPIGPLLAHAGPDAPSDTNRAPFHGYYYRILLTPAGSFAILAFPAEYRSSGVVTFIMDQDGTAYEKDLGPMTETNAKQILTYTPDNTWKQVVQ